MKYWRHRLRLYKRSIRFFFQRLIRGWDDSDLWNLDSSLAEVILPRLKRFKEVRGGYPSELSDKEWDQILQTMIEAFEFHVSQFKYECCDQKVFDKVQVGLDLFSKYYGALWF